MPSQTNDGPDPGWAQLTMTAKMAEQQRLQPIPPAWRCQSGALEKRVLACSRCGCRMVTKVGRRGNLLICSDCGVPVENLQGQQQHRQRLYAALALICMALVGGMIFLLAAIDERLSPWSDQTGQGDGGAGKGEESQRLPEPALLAPDPKPVPSASSPALPNKPANAQPIRELGLGKQRNSALPLPLHHRTQPGDHRPEP